MGKVNKVKTVSTVKVIVLALIGVIAGGFFGVQAFLHGWLG